MKPLIHIIPILKDNYAYILEGVGKSCVIIDPGESGPIKGYINKHNLQPAAILNTHHHHDHTGGNADLERAYNVPVTGPERERLRIPTLTHGVTGGDIVDHFGLTMSVMDTPGHTKGHIVFYWKAANALFSGDTLFSLGCGRLLEGTAQEMFDSLQTLKTLPPETRIFCGHEYTLANGKFALDIDPDNADLKERMKEVAALRAKNRPTLPVTLELELKTNPFLRAGTVAEFADLRQRKDNF